MGTDDSFSETKRSGREADQPPPSVEDKSECSYSLHSLVYLRKVHSDNFTSVAEKSAGI